MIGNKKRTEQVKYNVYAAVKHIVKSLYNTGKFQGKNWRKPQWSCLGTGISKLKDGLNQLKLTLFVTYSVYILFFKYMPMLF